MNFKLFIGNFYENKISCYKNFIKIINNWIMNNKLLLSTLIKVLKIFNKKKIIFSK